VSAFGHVSCLGREDKLGDESYDRLRKTLGLAARIKKGHASKQGKRVAASKML